MTDDGKVEDRKSGSPVNARQRMISWAVHENPKFKKELKKALAYLVLGQLKLGFLNRWAESDFKNISDEDRAVLTLMEHNLFNELHPIAKDDPALFNILVAGQWARRTIQDPMSLAGREFFLAMECCIRCLGLVRKYPRLKEILGDSISSLESLLVRAVEQSTSSGVECLLGYERETQDLRNVLVDIRLLDRPLPDADTKCGNLGNARIDPEDALKCYYLHKNGKSYSQIAEDIYGDGGPAGKQRVSRNVTFFREVACLGPAWVQGRWDTFAVKKEKKDDKNTNLAKEENEMIQRIALQELVDRLRNGRLIEEDMETIGAIKAFIGKNELAKGKEISAELIIDTILKYFSF